MDLILRPVTQRDARDGGRVLYEAFKSLADRHGFPADFPSVTWCLANGFRLVMQMTLMTIGFYNEPAGAYLPSVLY